MTRGKKIVLSVLLIIFVLLALLMILVLTKKVSVNGLFTYRYTLNGVDVSNYQGSVDWDEMASQDIDFAFIKATEGSSHVDKSFQDNWSKIAETDIYAGAYHFFSFESSGKTQAENYINTVGSLEGKMRPAVDVEYYGSKAREDLDYEAIKAELGVLLEELEAEYGVKPVIYCTYKAYDNIICGDFDDYDLWIRNIYITPDVTLSGRWMYWQYTDKAELSGYSGPERYIDMNVFRGSIDEFLIYNNIQN